MAAFHFAPASYALDDLRKRRPKISLIDDLNDPFELLAADLRDKKARALFKSMRDDLALRFGILCFSKSWRSPVMWSHYADKHRGVCLGFEIPNAHAGHVTYDATRLTDVIRPMLTGDPKSQETVAKRLLFTKYQEWKYEREVRIFAELKDVDASTGHYFADFGADLRLTSVIFGPRFGPDSEQFVEAVRPWASGVEVIWSRLAFKSYAVVPIKGRRLVV